MQAQTQAPLRVWVSHPRSLNPLSSFPSLRWKMVSMKEQKQHIWQHLVNIGRIWHINTWTKPCCSYFLTTYNISDKILKKKSHIVIVLGRFLFQTIITLGLEASWVFFVVRISRSKKWPGETMKPAQPAFCFCRRRCNAAALFISVTSLAVLYSFWAKELDFKVLVQQMSTPFFK